MMATKLKPWKLRTADYSKPGWHTRPTVGYELMFEFLRLSPSYELARKSNQEGLTDDDKKLLPSDFNQVLKTYKLLGNVQRYLFRSWWLKRGLKVFGNPHSKPKVHKFGFLPNGVDVSPDLVMEELEKILSDTRRDEGLGSTLLISVPLGRRKGEVLKEISRILDEQVDSSASTSSPLIELEGQRLRAKVLFNGIRLLTFKAARPKWELWRLGAITKLSKTYSQELDPKSPRKTADKTYDREMMSKITYRALLKFEAIAENAARGKFPSDAPVDQVPFDYPLLVKIIQRKNMWEDQEKKRLLEAYETRLALKQQMVAES